jgi:hypothetical protein
VAAAGYRCRVSSWWVNQRQSWPVESTLGVLWAPLRGRAGQRVPHFDRLTMLQPGDTVFHYAGGCIVAVSEVMVAAEQRERPYEPDGRDGWLVRVRVHELDRYIPLHEVPETVRVASAGPGSVFDTDGGVGNGYLFELRGPALTAIADIAGLEPQSAADSNQPAVSALFDRAETDGLRVGSYRLEQPGLRRALLQRRAVAPCDFCGRILPTRLLVTAHIKPRALCSWDERTDVHIAVLACVLGCDALFEHGYITVDTITGMIRATRPASMTVDLEDAVGDLVGRRFHRLTRHNRDYFRWHATHHGHHSEQAGLVLVDAGEGAADPGTVPPVLQQRRT